MNQAIRICARLLRAGALPLIDVPELELPEVRREVERRLRSVGLVLATSTYSGHVGIRLAPEVAGDPAFEAASNLGLKADACALLVVLWVRLVLPRRQTGERMPEAQVSMVITSFNQGTPPEPEPVTRRPYGLDADDIIGGQPAAFEVIEADDVFVVWWQLSPPGFPDRWIEVRADFRASHPIDRDRIFPTIQALLESVEFRD